MADELVERVLRGEARAIGRAISLAENEAPGHEELLGALYRQTGHAYRLGVTGPPGAGKSSLVDALVRLLRAQGLGAGILAVDPSSPFTGGAILGDRIRMQAHAYDRGVFIRSMSARGHLGGLAAATNGAAHILDAAGKDVVIVETVGVGQSELEIAGTADTTVVVLTPAAGDMVQMLKAGIMEIADVFVVNKADMEGAGRLARDLRTTLNMGEHGAWIQPIVQTQATKGEGVERVWAEVQRHRAHLESTGTLDERRRQRLRAEILDLVLGRVQRTLVDDLRGRRTFDHILDRATAREIDPYQAANAILQSGLLAR
jgi:LAO/AO transport system kinase